MNSVPKANVFEVGMAVKIVDRAVKQLAKTDEAKTEKIVVDEFTKSVKDHKGE